MLHLVREIQPGHPLVLLGVQDFHTDLDEGVHLLRALFLIAAHLVTECHVEVPTHHTSPYSISMLDILFLLCLLRMEALLNIIQHLPLPC